MDTGIEGMRPESADGTLVIVVCRGKHLPNRRRLDKQSPYVILRIGTTCRKTEAHFRSGQVPEWTQEVRFDLTRDKKPLLKVDVLDETKNEPTPIGSTEIDCSVLFDSDKEKDNRYIHDSWYELSLNGRKGGMIYLEMTFYPKSPMVPPKVPPIAYDEERKELFDDSDSAGIIENIEPPPKHPTLTENLTVNEVFEQSKPLKKKTFLKNLGALAAPPSSSPREYSVKAPKQKDTSPKKNSKFNKFLPKLKTKGMMKNFIMNYDHEDPVSPVSELSFGKEENDDIDPPKSFEDDDEDDGFELQKPVPPQHSASPSRSSNRHSSTTPPPIPPHGNQLSPYKLKTKTSPTKKPPPEDTVRHSHGPKESLLNSTSVPFSADTIGIEDDGDKALPTSVYLLGQPVTSLKYPGENNSPDLDPDEIDPKYYAPTPSKHLEGMKTQKGAEKGTLDLRTEETGYIGDGKWNMAHKFSPSIFDRIPHHNDENTGYENKPKIPPKIPNGMSDKEYYAVDKDSFLKDVNGRRH